MLDSLLLLFAGVALAIWGGTLFVNGGVGLAQRARWPTAVIGVTVAAFGTSSPELLVAVRAAQDGVANISLGNVLGANVINVALVMGLVLSMGGLRTGEDGGSRRDWAAALLLPGLMAVLLLDGWFSRVDAFILLAVFVLWLVVVLRHALGHAAREEGIIRPEPVPKRRKVMLELVCGLGLLLVASDLVVTGGRGVAQALGWSSFVVGAVVVALATTTPELSVSLVSRFRGHDDIGLGNILGSNIFNACVVGAVTALIQPYAVKRAEVMPSLACGAVAVLLIWPPRSGFLRRWHGFVLLALYVVYVSMTLGAGGAGR
ncbi:MAG: calcium/sodium antiporter [Prosthecobacter sp.]|nr:calcium/sodium antiporter [Prosthecobacter sp.]